MNLRQESWLQMECVHFLPDISPGLQVRFISLWSSHLILLIGQSASCLATFPGSWVGFLAAKPALVTKTAPIGIAVRGADQTRKLLHWLVHCPCCQWFFFFFNVFKKILQTENGFLKYGLEFKDKYEILGFC